MNNNAPKKEPSPTMIYVSNLPFTTKDEQLRGLFEGFEVKTAYVATRRNGRSKGFGFVNLAKTEDQNKAIEKVDGTEFDGRKITAKIAFNDERRNEKGELKEEFKKQLPNKTEGPPSETAVYVSNLPWSYKDEDLRKFFGEGLKIKSANVALRRNGKSKGFGFVEFETNEDQKKALEFDQKKIEDRVITVKVSVNYRGANQQNSYVVRGNNNNNNNRRGGSGGRRNNRGYSANRGGYNNNRGGYNNNRNRPPPVVNRRPKPAENSLYISNLPFDLDDSDLRQIFNEFNVKNANIAARPNGRSLGFGFVEFNNAEDQKNAREALDQSEVNGRLITVKVATGGSGGNNNNNNNNRRRGGAGGNFGGQRRQRRSGLRRNRPNEKREPSATMIYVSNLPFSVDDKGLESIFAGYKVKKAYVAVRRNGRSKGFGFVDFDSNEDQQKALKLQGQEVEGRPLTIQVANKVAQNEKQESNDNQNSGEDK